MLAYMETLYHGLVPCKVLRHQLDTVRLATSVTLTIKVTATRGPYVRGDTFHLPFHRVIPRAVVRRRKHGTYILPHDWFAILQTETIPSWSSQPVAQLSALTGIRP